MGSIEVVLPFQIDFVWYRTVDQRFVYILQDAAGAPTDNTGYFIALEMRKDPNSAALVTRTTTNGGIILGGPTGVVTILTPCSLLTDIVEATYQHDVIQQPPGGDREMVFRGTIAIRPGITQSVP